MTALAVLLAYASQVVTYPIGVVMAWMSWRGQDDLDELLSRPLPSREEAA